MSHVRLGSVLAAVGLAAGALSFASPPPSAGATAAPTTTPSGCQLGNGVKHVIEVTFDNVHFNRDNPNVLSDLEQMPALLDFIKQGGTLLSNNHTPLIAHTADDTLTNYTGLYGDRQGMGISNDYYVYRPDGSVSPQQTSFGYWTDPGYDAYPNMPYSAAVPATGAPAAPPPAPWVPFTRAGCDVGAVSTANMELENVAPDLANAFGTSSPEALQLSNDRTRYQDQETNDYLGLAVHCAQGDAFCATAAATKYGQTTPSYDAVADNLASEPGGYMGTSPSGGSPGSGYLAVFGHKYLQPQVVADATNAITCPADGSAYHQANGNCYEVANSSGHLVDLNGQEIDGEYPDAPGPGFPGFGPITAAQSLAYVADLQESGVPVTYAYISDVHEVKPYDTATCSPGSYYLGSATGNADGPGDPCYAQTTAAYNTAFAEFFQRLKDDNITPANTEFVFGADEGDHFAGANVGRAETPACTGTPLTTTYQCSYSSSPQQIGEVQTDIHGLLAAEDGDTTPFTSQPQGESVYVTGNQPSSSVRQLERDFGNVTIADPYDGTTETATKWMVDQTGEQLLHVTDADPNRTPTFSVFPKPDVYFTGGSSDHCRSGVTAATAPTKCTLIDNQYAWNHGYYAPEIDTTWLGLVGPGVANDGVDGFGPGDGPSSAGTANSGTTTVPQIDNPGTWADQTDIRPTLLSLVGLKDDYAEDGRVLTEVLTTAPGQTGAAEFLPLAQCYKQLDASVGRFGTDVITADTAAMESGSASGDSGYQSVTSHVQSLGSSRDTLAAKVKQELFDAEFDNTALPPQANGQVQNCMGLLRAADGLGGSSGG